jgi:hypothetical protein
MVPSLFNGSKIQNVNVDGGTANFLLQNVKGVNYAFLPVTAGVSHQIIVTYK